MLVLAGVVAGVTVTVSRRLPEGSTDGGVAVPTPDGSAIRDFIHVTDLADAIAPGHSGILALVSDPGVIEIRKALDKANKIVEKAVDNVVADDIKAAAKESEGAAEA